jgi:hypothetical protein
MGLEGIVSKRLGSRYVSGRSKDWLKFKNPDAPAVKREAEEDWGAGEVALMGKGQIMIQGPKADGTYVVTFRTAADEALAISVTRDETAVLKHFQERMPEGLLMSETPQAHQAIGEYFSHGFRAPTAPQFLERGPMFTLSELDGGSCGTCVR